MQKLDNNVKYSFTSEETFRNELDNVHSFVMKNYKIGMHVQDFFEINIITKGRGKHYFEDNVVDAEIGDVFIIPPTVEHGYVGGEGFDVFHVLLSDRFIEKNMNELQMLPSFFTLFSAEPLIRAKTKIPLHLKLTKSQFEIIYGMLHQTLGFVSYRISFDCLVRSSLAMSVIALLCKSYTENNELTAGTDAEKDNDEAFMKAISYIHENYQKKITIDELASISCMSRSTFVRKFRKICKTSPLDYVTWRRIKAAEYMLLNTKYSILDVAFKCGFYDAAHFYRTFLEHKGISPSAYRKNGGNAINQTSGS